MHARLVVIATLAFTEIPPALAAEPLTRSRLRPVSCAALCAELGNLIRQDPGKLIMGLEDALVVSESCTREIITMAIDAVNADPRRVQQIYEAAVKVVPHRKDEIWQAVRRFSVPAAHRFREPALQVRRAKLPGGDQPAVLEIRRAEAPHSAGSEPINEIRRAVLPDPKD